MTKQQAAVMLVKRTFEEMCFEKPSFSSEDIKQECLLLIEKELEKTVFLNEVIAE
jgi:hypothetical protein